MYGFKWPSKPEEREENFYVIGTDGLVLLNAVYQDLDREWLRHIPAVDVLRQVWIQQYHVHGDQVRLREPKDTPPGACADSDTTNIAGNPYDTEMWSNSFDLTGVTAASLDLNYRHRQLGISVFDIDISTDGGATWTNEFSDTAGNPSGTAGDPLSLDLAAYIGNPNVIARFRYYYGDSWDWFAQVDDVSLSCHVPSIDFEKTVGTDPNVCATENNIIVASGTDVTYCYEVTNAGNVTLTQHDVVDTELGTLRNNFPFVLTPGNSTFVTLTVISNQTTVNTGTWTAYNPGPTDVAFDTDSATVTVEAPIIEV